MSELTLALLKVSPLFILFGVIFFIRKRRRVAAHSAAAGLGPVGDYVRLAAAANLDRDAEPDWAALRRAYLGSDMSAGGSRFLERQTVEAESEAERSELLLLRDFPLLSTQLEAAEYFRVHPEEFGADMHQICVKRFHQLARHIERSGRETPEGTAYPVLSMDEEYAYLTWLGLMLDPDGEVQQSLLFIDGVPHDRFQIGSSVVLFDISDFYMRQSAALKDASGAGS